MTTNHTTLLLPAIALGTMTWGEQNSQDEAFAQMDYALAHGWNFFDTAELYSIPPRAETYSATETIIGNWFRARGGRDRVTLASKVCGPTVWCPHIREGKARLDGANIIAACDASLTRLQTDYIDLYQLHWPDRNCNFFGKLGYAHQPDEVQTPIVETLQALAKLVTAGKVRYIGLSNETPWGVMEYLRLAHELGLPRIATIQNPYSLLNRSYEIGLAEISCRESVPLLAYSPLGFGMLSGKYIGGVQPKDARLTLFDTYNRYSNPQAVAATDRYVELARKYGLDPAQMALAFVRQQPFVGSTIIGATTMTQLQSNFASAELVLSPEVMEEIEAIHRCQPNPAP